MIYVFCGHDYLSTDDGYMNSIEVIKVKYASIDKEKVSEENGWKLLNTLSNQLSTRINPAVAPISPYEIVILGGARAGKKYCSDGYIWNTANEEFTQILDSESSFEFTTYGNMFGQAGRGKVAGLVTDKSK